MFRRKPTIYFTEPDDFRAGNLLEDFCDNLMISHFTETQALRPEDIAQEFRTYFRVPSSHVPIPFVRGLIEKFEISLKGTPCQSGIAAMWTYNLTESRYEITTPYNCSEEAVSLLHELFEIIYWRCYHRNRHRVTQWLRQLNICQPHQVADIFAYALVLPRHEFQAKAEQSGINIYYLANHFGVRPATIHFAVNLQFSSTCPLFLIRLSFRNLSCQDQVAIRFDTTEKRESVPAVVWKQSLKRGLGGKSRNAWRAMELLGEKCPGKHELIDVDGIAYQAIHEGRSLMDTTDQIFGMKLPTKVFVVARPNSNKDQMYVQIVPIGYEKVLMDDVLREQAAGTLMITPTCSPSE